MKILFVWPNKGSFGFKPISLALLSAALKRDGHEVELFDTTFIDFGYKDGSEIGIAYKVFKPVDYSSYDISKRQVDLKDELFKKLDDFKPDAVGISALSDEKSVGFAISKIVKEWNVRIPVIWGGKFATMSPEQALADRNIDYVCLGEGTEFVSEFVHCLESKEGLKGLRNIAYRDRDKGIVKNELRPFLQDLDSLPFLDWSIFDQRHFLKPFDGRIYNGGDHMIQWGCPYRCTYCINHSYRRLYGAAKSGEFLRLYSIDRIIKELSHLVKKWNINFFKFHDENFLLKPIPYFRELAEKYRRLVNVPFTIMVNARNVTEEKVELLKQMNCVSVSIGIETGNEALRKKILKRTETKEDIIRSFRLFNNYGIRTTSFNMLGLPFENRTTIMETIALNRESQVCYPNVVFFYPLEGTELREVSIRHGFFDPHGDNNIFDDINPSLTLPEISKDELIALRERFVLYVKMPQVYYKYIERSEKKDWVGQELTKTLYSLYEECVFAHDGIWQDGPKTPEYLNRLEKIYSSQEARV